VHNINRANTRIAIWISYDIGNTTFFAGIMGILFPLWMTDVMKGNDATLGFTLTIAMAMVLVLSPILGTFSDHIRRRMPFVIVFTIICIIATAFIGIEGPDGNIYVSLCLFAIAVMATHFFALNAPNGNSRPSLMLTTAPKLVSMKHWPGSGSRP